MRTPESLQLERILHSLPARHLFCWNGHSTDEMYDCGCVLVSEEYWGDCNCVCHVRIAEIAALPNIKLWIYGLTHSPDKILSIDFVSR